MKGIINISGEFGVDVHLQDVVGQVASQPNAKSFDVFINSEGGSLQLGYDIYNYFKKLESKGIQITTIGHGMVASAATIAFLGGSVRKADRNTDFMIHLPAIGMQGYMRSSDLMEEAKYMQKVERDAVNFYSKALNIEPMVLLRMLENETFLNEEQLFNLGFTTERTGLRVVAKLINKPINREMKREKSILNRIKALLSGNVMMKTYKTADELDLVFDGVEDDADIQVGDTATLDGEAPEGDITLANGWVVTFEAGVVTAIDKGEEPAEGDIEEIAIVVEEIAETQEATVEVLEELVTEFEELKEEVAAKLRDITAREKRLSNLGKVNSQRVKETPKMRKGASKGSDLSGAIANLRNKKK